MRENENTFRDKNIKKVSIIGICANVFLLVIKGIIGFISNSHAMIADSLNSAGDIFASIMSFIGAKLSSKPKDDDHPYGHGKAEYIFSFLISISMIIASIIMVKTSIESIVNKNRVNVSIFLVLVCIVTILIKLFLFLYAYRKNKETESITPLAKAKEALIILSLFFVFINTGIIPSRVDKPAIPVIKNEKYNLFMINTMLNLEKNAKLC